ncbi:MAG: helix-turn-helix domain-containing protein [Planctomycetota bacterium]|nr:helix-turn-helix domain-containing protein [Planctomycetota bacterium]
MIAENETLNDGCDDPKLLTVSALAGCLSVSVRQAHRMNKAEVIPRPLRIGGCVRWREDEISEWLKCGAPCRLEWEQRRDAELAPTVEKS